MRLRRSPERPLSGFATSFEAPLTTTDHLAADTQALAELAAEAAVEAVLAVVRAQMPHAPPVVRVVESARAAAILAAVEATSYLIAERSASS